MLKVRLVISIFNNITNKAYRVGVNLLARAMRALMRLRGDNDGFFCVGSRISFYELNGMRFVYSFSKFGCGGNIDSGGSTELQTRMKIAEFLNEDFVFYDVGAHEGLFSIDLKKRFPRAKIYAFEPLAVTLKENLSLNGLNHVEVVECAIGEKPGNVYLTFDKRSSNHIVFDAGSNRKVAIESLDRLVEHRSLELPDVIKLDIEGFEFFALKGAHNILSSPNQPVVITEINECFKRYDQSLLDFFDYMGRLGFQPFTLQDHELRRLAHAVLSIDDLPSSADSNYWWLPDEAARSKRLNKFENLISRQQMNSDWR